MELTREQAIAGHRKMWRWIAEEIKYREEVCTIQYLKLEYLCTKGYRLKDGCFLCEYTKNRACRCYCCPVSVPPGRKEIKACLGGLYYECSAASDWMEQYIFARQIAELPEREDV